MNIVLYEPEMPANTGNIGRTCVATQTRLHLIEPLGFKLNEKAVKKAGLDYWDKLDVRVYCNFEEFLEQNPGARLYLATTKAKKTYTEVNYDPDAFLMFGPESRGIKAAVESGLTGRKENTVRGVDTGGDFGPLSRSLYPYSHVGGNPFPEFIQFCSNYSLRSPAPKRFFGDDNGRKPPLSHLVKN